MTAGTRAAADGEATTIDISRHGPVAIVRAPRSLTFDKGHLGLRREVGLLLDGGARAFAIDVSDVTAIDSYGVAELVSCHTAITRSGGRAILCAPARKVRDVLAVTRLDRIVEVCDTEAQAIAALAPNQG